MPCVPLLTMLPTTRRQRPIYAAEALVFFPSPVLLRLSLKHLQARPHGSGRYLHVQCHPTLLSVYHPLKALRTQATSHIMSAPVDNLII
jgi:hypothetical protein